jgi:hypothetical protein
MGADINDAKSHDTAERIGRILVEISGGPAENSTAFSLISVNGVGIDIGVDSVTLGTDSMNVMTAGKATLRRLELTFALTEDHKFTQDLWKDMVNDGARDKVFKTLSLKFHNRAGDLIRQIDYADCFMEKWDLCESDANARNEYCIVRHTWCLGYTTAGLLT